MNVFDTMLFWCELHMIVERGVETSPRYQKLNARTNYFIAIFSKTYLNYVCVCWEKKECRTVREILLISVQQRTLSEARTSSVCSRNVHCLVNMIMAFGMLVV